MVAVTYERWSFTRSSSYRALTGKNLVFWIGGRLGEVVAHGGSTKVHIPVMNYCSVQFYREDRVIKNVYGS